MLEPLFINSHHYSAKPHRVLDPEHAIRTGFYRALPGYGVIREKGSLDWLLIYTRKGSGRITLRDELRDTRPGDLYLWPQGVRHDYRLAEESLKWEILWAHFIPRPHWHLLLNWPAHGDDVRHLQISAPDFKPVVEKVLLEMVGYSNLGSIDREEFAMNALERVLLYCGMVNPLSPSAVTDPRIQKAMDFMRDNAARGLSMDQIAEACSLSGSRFSHLFKRQVGTTPMAYLEDVRLDKARNMLEESPFNISEIAYRAGFESLAYFSRRFSLKTGFSPREYRKLHVASSRIPTIVP